MSALRFAGFLAGVLLGGLLGIFTTASANERLTGLAMQGPDISAAEPVMGARYLRKRFMDEVGAAPSELTPGFDVARENGTRIRNR